MAREALGRAKGAMQEQRFGSAHKEFTTAMELDQRGEVKFEVRGSVLSCILKI